MNIVTIIQDALDALNNNADLFLLEKSRAENRELEHNGDTIIIFPDWRTANTFTQGLELNKNRVYNIDFKTLDEWDNSDDNELKSYDSEPSIEKIKDMEVLANSIFSYIAANNNLYPEIREKLKWRKRSLILRYGNGTMSGVRIQLTIVFRGTIICDYTT